MRLSRCDSRSTSSGRAKVIGKIAEQSIGALLDPAQHDQWYNPSLLAKIRCPTLVLWTRHNPGQLVPLAEEVPV